MYNQTDIKNEVMRLGEDVESIDNFLKKIDTRLSATLELVRLLLEELNLDLKVTEPEVKFVKKSKKK